MKILVAAPYFWPRQGGMENYATALAAALASRGHEVRAISSAWERLGQPETLQGPVPVTRLPWRFKVGSTPVGRFGPPLRRCIAEWQPDVVWAHTPVPYMADLAIRAARQSRTPSLLTYQNDLDATGWLRPVQSAYHVLMGRRTIAAADRILVTSNEYAASSPILRPHLSKVVVIPPGVDRTRFFPEARPSYRAELGLGTAPVALFVGQMEAQTRHKGTTTLLEAFARVQTQRPAHLLLAGRGEGVATVLQLARRLGVADRVHALGFVPDHRLPGLFAEADVVTLPSVGRAEGFGMVLLEAQASGTPVIACRTGGMPAALADGITGLLVEPADVDDLAAALQSVLGNPAERDRLSQATVAWVANRFDWNRSAALLEAAMHDVRGH